jgi:polysaccharide biosynthesis/export protein
MWVLSIVALCLTFSCLLYAQDKGLLDIDKLLQSRPDIRSKITGAGKTTAAETVKPSKKAGEPATAVQEKETSLYPTLETLIREKGITPPEELKVFGQQLFSAGPTSFTPPANIPVTTDYVVGPDDTVVVNVWGRLNETYTLTVQRNGSVYIPQVGSIHVAGLTYKQLIGVIRKEVESVLGVTASVSMGELRSVTVFVVGAVKQPGAYTVSAFDTILNALIYAGGPETKSLVDDWYRNKLREENVDVRQLVERLKKERDKIYDQEKERIYNQEKERDKTYNQEKEKDKTYGQAKGRPGEAPAQAAVVLPPPSRIGKTSQSSTLMQLMAILTEERESEEVIKRLRELDGEQLQKELTDLETVENKQNRFTSLRQLIEKLKNDKEMAERAKDYETLNSRQLEDELRKLSVSDRPERDYTLQQHVFAEERYKGAQQEKEILLAVQIGSMRNIQLKRADKVVSTFDLYDLILNGDKSKDLRLQQGDVIFVPKPAATVAILGDVKVPAVYELKEDQSLLAALELAGGLKTSAFGGQIQVQRYAKNQERMVLDASLDALKARTDPFILQDGDRVNLFRVADEDVNAVYLFGNVKRPGKYQFRSNVRVSDVVGEENLQPETDFSYAFIKRYNKPAMTPTIVPFKLGEAILQKSPTEDRILQPYDEIYVFRQWDFVSKPDITVGGEVRNPGKYPFHKDMRVKDALLMAGGPNVYASLSSAHIFRTDPQTRSVTMLLVDITNALAERTEDNIVLKDKDRLVIHHIQENTPEKFVTIDGEVRNPGQYPLTEGMTVRDFIFAAGNIRESAYLDDAELTSMITESGRSAKYVQRNLDLRKIFDGDAAQNVLLRPYDRLFVKRIPDWRLEHFATIAGEVRFPGTYAIQKGERLSSLIERAGGYTSRAYLRSAFFTRERVRELQQAGLSEMADRMQREMLSAGSAQLSTAASTEEVAALQGEQAQKQKFIESIKALKATGRMTIQLGHLRLLKGSEFDIELEDKDKLSIGEKNSVVNVLGSVMSQGSFVYSDKVTYEDYIGMTGGYSTYADKSNTFILKADGSAQKVAGGWFNWSTPRNRWEFANYGEEIRTVEPGDTIVVPDKVERIAWLREIKDITQILMNIAVSAGVVLRL